MKFGLLYNEKTTNLGDDIQAYAIERLLPRVDYFVHREALDRISTQNDEPVAVVMAAWFMSRKWQWPPKKNIVPLFVGFHYTNFAHYPDKYFKLNYEYISGCGADYLKAYGPIGCRDLFTMEELQKRGIDAYFSGCITLTLPKMPTVQKEREYVCLVDVDKDVENHLREKLEGKNIDIKIFHHDEAFYGKDASWSIRRARVEERLTVYQNAKYVLTRRLHCCLPCLAMGVPVMVVTKRMKIKDFVDLTRFRPYNEWLEIISTERFLKGDFKFDLFDPKPNSEAYLPYRELLINKIGEFTAQMEKEEGDYSDYVKTSYTDEELLSWQNALYKETLTDWFNRSKKLFAEISRLKSENVAMEKNLEKSLNVSKDDSELVVENKALIKDNVRLRKELALAKEKIAAPLKFLDSKPIQWAIKVRKKIKTAFKK